MICKVFVSIARPAKSSEVEKRSGQEPLVEEKPLRLLLRVIAVSYGWSKGTSTENWVRTGIPPARGTVVFHFKAA